STRRRRNAATNAGGGGGARATSGRSAGEYRTPPFAPRVMHAPAASLARSQAALVTGIALAWRVSQELRNEAQGRNEPRCRSCQQNKTRRGHSITGQSSDSKD